MTLIISLRTLDGIVIAGDSLATMMGNMAIQADINMPAVYQCVFDSSDIAEHSDAIYYAVIRAEGFPFSR